jgi:hypothetical protein
MKDEIPTEIKDQMLISPYSLIANHSSSLFRFVELCFAFRAFLSKLLQTEWTSGKETKKHFSKLVLSFSPFTLE